MATGGSSTETAASGGSRVHPSNRGQPSSGLKTSTASSPQSASSSSLHPVISAGTTAAILLDNTAQGAAQPVGFGSSSLHSNGVHTSRHNTGVPVQTSFRLHVEGSDSSRQAGTVTVPCSIVQEGRPPAKSSQHPQQPVHLTIGAQQPPNKSYEAASHAIDVTRTRNPHPAVPHFQEQHEPVQSAAVDATSSTSLNVAWPAPTNAAISNGSSPVDCFSAIASPPRPSTPNPNGGPASSTNNAPVQGDRRPLGSQSGPSSRQHPWQQRRGQETAKYHYGKQRYWGGRWCNLTRAGQLCALS